MLLTLNIKTLFLKMYKINLNFKDHKFHKHVSKVRIKMGRMSHSSACNEDHGNCPGAINFPSLLFQLQTPGEWNQGPFPPTLPEGLGSGRKPS